MLTIKMLPGQEPYTPDELRRLTALVGIAAEQDPGEQGEIEGRTIRPGSIFPPETTDEDFWAWRNAYIPGGE